MNGATQSTLIAHGPEAARVVLLGNLMFWGAALITLIVVVATAVALWAPARWRRPLQRHRVVLLGGVAFPVVTLTALMLYGFQVLDAGDTLQNTERPMQVRIVGKRWWWQVFYTLDDGTTLETANELRMPVGRVLRIDLETADVLHSFWVPALAGKVDMIPGRTNTLHLRADNAGVYRGQCAEYCGGAHALMSFVAVAMAPGEFETWLARERSAAADRGTEGEQLFHASGCGGCHRVRGTAASGRIGPDLTHVGSRYTVGAGILPTSESAFVTWLDRHQQIKPGNRMPKFAFLSRSEKQALGRYLASLE